MVNVLKNKLGKYSKIAIKKNFKRNKLKAAEMSSPITTPLIEPYLGSTTAAVSSPPTLQDGTTICL